jgi:hypothetical protein
VKLLALLLSLIASVASASATHTEAQLVGSWTFASMDSTHTLTFERDHTFWSSTWTGGERFVDSSGTWQLRGTRLRRTITYIAAEGQKVPRHLTDTISHLDQKTLAFSSGLTYTRDNRPPKPTI